MSTERLQAYLAHAGVASRRKAEGLMTSGHVFVNGVRVTKLGTKVDPARDEVRVDERIVTAQTLVYYALHKPIGYVSARTSPHADQLVTELVPNEPAVIPVGRLDKRSSGLMILTNDGPFAYQLTHPKFVHEKEYEISVRCPSVAALPLALERLGRGVRVNRERQEFDRCEIVSQAGDQATLRVTLHTGKKRQIRRMAAAVGLAVPSLQRIRIGHLHLGNLQPGQWRVITPSDVIDLRLA